MIAGLLAACGSGSATKSLTKADFIAQADGICTKYEESASRASRSLKPPDVDRRIAVVQDHLVPLLERRNTQLAQLTPPAGDRATIAQFIADLEAATNAIARDPAGFVAAHGTTPFDRKAAAEAAAYGFTVCART